MLVQIWINYNLFSQSLKGLEYKFQDITELQETGYFNPEINRAIKHVKLWALGDCLARSHLTAIPHFASWTSPIAKLLQPQLTRARTT